MNIKRNKDKLLHFNKFKYVNNKLTAYILGLIWADGHIVKNLERSTFNVVFSTTYPDANYFIKIFNKNGKWNIYSYTPNSPSCFKYKKLKKSCIIKITNKDLTNFLESKNYKTKKHSSACKILKIIPKKLKHYWFLGLFDGDGNISIRDKKAYNVNVSSSYDQDWTFLERFLKKINVKYKIKRRIRKRGKSSELNINNRNDSLKFLSTIYKNYNLDKLGLPRKFNKYLEMKKTLKNKQLCKK
jgi:LAGLIDADG-like domain